MARQKMKKHKKAGSAPPQQQVAVVVMDPKASNVVGFVENAASCKEEAPSRMSLLSGTSVIHSHHHLAQNNNKKRARSEENPAPPQGGLVAESGEQLPPNKKKRKKIKKEKTQEQKQKQRQNRIEWKQAKKAEAAAALTLLNPNHKHDADEEAKKKAEAKKQKKKANKKKRLEQRNAAAPANKENDSESGNGEQPKSKKWEAPPRPPQQGQPKKKNRKRNSSDANKPVNANGETARQVTARQGTIRFYNELMVEEEVKRKSKGGREGAQSVVVVEPAVLKWNSPVDYVSAKVEEKLVYVLLPKWKKERAMLRDLPSQVCDIKRHLEDVGGMTILQACFFRRDYMRYLNPRIPNLGLRLGSDPAVQASAQRFEKAVEEFLKSQQIPFWTEDELRKIFHKRKKENENHLTATPDCLLRQPVLLERLRGLPADQRVLDKRNIYWIEVKMFYGAFTIPQGTPSAVGKLMKQAKKYVAHFGPGAIVFMEGCDERLAAKLAALGVTALDTTGTVSVGRVKEHQRTWCATRDGEILP